MKTLDRLCRPDRHAAYAAGGLAIVQLAHLLDVLRYSEHATFPRVLFDPLGLAGVGASVAALLGVVLGVPGRHTLAMVVGAGIAVGFTLYHGVPVDLGINNPYWGKADAIQWITVILAIAIAVLCAWYAYDARRRGVEPAQRSHATA